MTRGKLLALCHEVHHLMTLAASLGSLPVRFYTALSPDGASLQSSCVDGMWTAKVLFPNPAEPQALVSSCEAYIPDALNRTFERLFLMLEGDPNEVLFAGGRP